LGCPSSPSLADETGEGRPFVKRVLSFILPCSSASSDCSGGSLLGTGVSCELGGFESIFFCKEPLLSGAVKERSGRAFEVDVAFGVLWKKLCSVFWLFKELDCLNPEPKLWAVGVCPGVIPLSI